MSDRRIQVADRALQTVITDILDRLDRIDGGATPAGWPNFPKRIDLGDGSIVIRSKPGGLPDELQFLFVNRRATAFVPPFTYTVIATL